VIAKGLARAIGQAASMLLQLPLEAALIYLLGAGYRAIPSQPGDIQHAIGAAGIEPVLQVVRRHVISFVARRFDHRTIIALNIGQRTRPSGIGRRTASGRTGGAAALDGLQCAPLPTQQCIDGVIACCAL
jgi:hypothetical protein